VTEPAPSGGPSPLRVGGLALLGAGAVAALIGLATLLPGGGGTATPATTEVAPATSAPPAVPSAVAPPSATVAAPPAVPTGTNAIAAPTAPAVVPTVPAVVPTVPAVVPIKPAPAPVAGGAATGHEPVRVYNNSTVTGLAARAADDFRADGWQVAQVANYPAGIIATSTVYYRPGTAEQTAASSLGSQFGLRVEPRFSGIDDATPGLIVIVTNDYQKRGK
jgi:LytR cell envelope-related transcriptional attenuator